MSAKTSLQALHEDKRGAIMLIGLCMSCFLIGSLWFLIGIGDAIVFRDNMQEATDHATFTSAVLHAKGMNFISACNLIMLALIAVHIILGIIHDLALAACILWFWTCGVWINARRVYTTYAKIFKPVCGAIHYAELGASYGYPLLAAYKGYRIGADYGEFSPKKHDVTMIVISPSIIPGSLVSAGLNKALTSKGTGKPDKDGKPTDDKSLTSTSQTKKGLPVESKKFSTVCEKLGKEVVSAIFGALGATGVVADKVAGWIGKGVKWRYCNDTGSTTLDGGFTGGIADGNNSISKQNDKIAKDNAKLPKGSTPKAPLESVSAGSGSGTGKGGSCMKDNSSLDPGFDSWWGCDGPLVPWGGSENGSPWMQVWGINLHPDFKDKSEHRVAIGGRKTGVASSAEESIYFSQAEFYFDCKEDWKNEECNKDDNAGYSIQWRGRLRRLEFPQIGAMIGSFAAEFLAGLKVYKDFQKLIGNGGEMPVKGADGKEPEKGLAATGFESLVNSAFKKYVTDPVKGVINSAGKGADKLLDPDLGAYH